jgi:IclR family transcriptional regulator, mhp operon transcriptional activator
MNDAAMPRKAALAAPYRDVRALRRGLALVESLAALGWARPGELARNTGLDRSSVYRLLDTLADTGFVQRREEDGAFALTAKIRNVADGVRRDEFLGQAQAHLAALTRSIQWPSDLALLKGGQVTIQDSTHSLSPITFHRATIRQERSLTASALGRAIMMQMTSVELDMALEIARASQPTGTETGLSRARITGLSRARIDDQLGSFREAGYAWAVGAVDPKVSAIALGFRGGGQVIGSVNIVFFRRVLSPPEAASRYLSDLRNCVTAIADAFGN